MKRKILDTEMARYVVLEPLAEGGMGAIYRGKKIGAAGSEKDVVLKQLLPEFTSQPEFIGLFLREAKLTASLDHVNIVRTLDLVASGESYFIVMEYVAGADLRAVLRKVRRRHSRLEASAGLLIAREILSGLDYAHSRRDARGQPLKVIHRDISPSNIMLSAAGEAKLTDFGIAKVSTHKSVFYRVKGKAGYMSPEQAFSDRPIDSRSDLYSVGVCLYESLTGERLFVADLLSSPGQIYKQPIPELEGTLDVPRGTDAVLRRALAVDRDLRYQSALEFQEDLLQLAYASGQMYTSHDLATHLHAQCGNNPARWRLEDDPEHSQPPTEVFSAATGSIFSGVELSSVLGAHPDSLSSKAASHPPGEASTEQLEFSASGWVTRSIDPDMLRVKSVATKGARPDSVRTSPLRPIPQTAGTIDDEPTTAYQTNSWTDQSDGSGSHAMTATSAFRPTTQDPPLHEMPTRTLARPATGPDHQTSAPRAPDPTRDPWDPHANHTAKTSAVALERREQLIILVAAALLFASAGILLTVAILEFGSEPQTEAALGEAIDLGVGTASGADSGPVQRADASAPAQPRGAHVRLAVVSVPEPADVYLDDSSQCVAPCTVDVPQDGGMHVLSVRKRHYMSWSTLVDAQRPPQAIKARLAAEPDPSAVGFVVIRSTTDADVLVDARPVGRVASAGRIPLPPGLHTVQLRHPRIKKRHRFVVEIKAGETVVRAVPF